MSQTAAVCRAAQLALLSAPAGMQGATPALGEGGEKKSAAKVTQLPVLTVCNFKKNMHTALTISSHEVCFVGPLTEV